MRNVKAFIGAGAEERAERSGHWLKSLIGNPASREWCATRGIALTKAAGESGNIGGGFAVPIDFDNAIIAVRDTVGAFRNAEVRPAKTDNTVRPRRIGGLVASFVAEGAPIQESQLQLDAVSTSLKKMAILTRSSSELFEDSAADLAEFLATEIGYSFAAKEDDCGFNGDGTSNYAGVGGLGTRLVGTASAITAITGHNTFLTLSATDIAALMGGVLATATPGARWYISAVGFGQCFCNLAGQSGGLVSRLLPDGSLEASYLGFPVEFSSKLPNTTGSLSGKPMLYFGNLKQSSVLVEHKSGTVVSASADRAMDQDEILVRGVRRMDIVNHTVGDATTYGPVAALFGG